MGSSAVRLAASVALALALPACVSTEAASSSRTSAARTTSPAPQAQAGIRGELLQYRRDVAARRLQVRLTAAAAGLVVESLELRSPSLVGRPPSQREGRLPAGSPLDFPVVMAAVDCAVRPGRPVAVVTVRDSAGSRRSVQIPLDDGGLVRRLHAADCAEQALLDQAAFEVTGLAPVTTDAGPAMRVGIRLSRAGGSDPVQVLRPEPNTIYDIEAVGPLPTMRGSAPVSFQLDMVPARCDAHALGESYRTSLIDLFVSLGKGSARLHTVTPAVEIRRKLESFAVETCRSAAN